MNRDADYLIKIIEEIGSPLLKAISAIPSTGAEVNLQSEAQSIAELLGKAVQVSIDLGGLIDIEKAPAEKTESLRLALTALASPIVAAQFTKLGKTPTDADLKRTINALESTLTFSDNFSPSKDNIERLDSLHSNNKIIDTHQIHIQYIGAFIPVINSISSYSFGQSEKKAIQIATDRIVKKSEQLATMLLTGAQDTDREKIAALSFVKALCECYSSAHNKQINVVMAMREPDQSAIDAGLQKIWDNFDLRAAMLESLVVHLVPDTKQAEHSNTGAESIAPKAMTNPLQTQEQATQPAQNLHQEPPSINQQQTPPPTETSPQTQTPPIFQTPQPHQESEPPTAAQAPEQPQPQEQESPLTNQQQAAPPIESPAQQAPPPIFQAQPQTETQQTQASQPHPNEASPMGFFKKPGTDTPPTQSTPNQSAQPPAEPTTPINPAPPVEAPVEQNAQTQAPPPIFQTPPQQNEPPAQNTSQAPPPVFQTQQPQEQAPPPINQQQAAPPTEGSAQQQTPPIFQAQPSSEESSIEGSGDQKDSGSGNPMSFFKTPPPDE